MTTPTLFFEPPYVILFYRFIYCGLGSEGVFQSTNSLHHLDHKSQTCFLSQLNIDKMFKEGRARREAVAWYLRPPSRGISHPSGMLVYLAVPVIMSPNPSYPNSPLGHHERFYQMSCWNHYLPLCVCVCVIVPWSGNLTMQWKMEAFSLPELFPLYSGGCHFLTGCQCPWLSHTKNSSLGGV